MKTINNLCIITARGGSKRIPRKNIKDFMGKPMIYYAINAAIKSEIFDEIMVSTDDEEISTIAKNLGAKVPFMRSKENSNDFATTSDVLNEVLLTYKNLGFEIKNYACIYPCVPFLNGEILKTAYKEFINSKCLELTSVVRFSFPIQRAFRLENGFLEYTEPSNASKRSQDLEPTFHDAGMFYFYKNKGQTNDKNLPFEIDEMLAQDIDTLKDWEIAELKYKILKGQK